MTLERVSQTAESLRRERRQRVPGGEPPGMLKLIKRFSRVVMIQDKYTDTSNFPLEQPQLITQCQGQRDLSMSTTTTTTTTTPENPEAKSYKKCPRLM